MATRLYFHAALSTVSGTLPTTEQSTNTSDKNGDAQSVNRSMNTTIGTSQTSILIASNSTTSAQAYYFTKFVSRPLNQTGITAQTWTLNYAAEEELSSSQFPAAGSGDETYVNLYVWNPTNGTKRGTIFDGDSNPDANEGSAGEEISVHTTFSGSAVSSAAVGDVIIYEVWNEITQSSSSSGDLIWYYDGTTVNTSNGSTVSNHASFLETPQTIAFQPDTITMTQVSAKTYSNKFITKV